MQKQLNPVKPTWCFSPAEPSLCLPFLKRLFLHQAPPEGQVDVGGNIYFPHPSTSIPSEKAEGVFLFIYLFFLLVCLLLRSTIIGKTSEFLMGYFSSLFFLCFVYSPNTVTSQFMKVFASDV